MIVLLKKILKAQTNYTHLGLRLIAILVFTGLIIYGVMPIVFWLLFGSGSSARDVSELAISQFIFFLSPLLLSIFIIGRRFKIHSDRNDDSKMKSYLIILVVLIVFYPFRMELIMAVYNLRELIID